MKVQCFRLASPVQEMRFNCFVPCILVTGSGWIVGAELASKLTEG